MSSLGVKCNNGKINNYTMNKSCHISSNDQNDDQWCQERVQGLKHLPYQQEARYLIPNARTCIMSESWQICSLWSLAPLAISGCIGTRYVRTSQINGAHPLAKHHTVARNTITFRAHFQGPQQPLENTTNRMCLSKHNNQTNVTTTPPTMTLSSNIN